MGRKHTRRRVWALVNPIAHAMEGAAVTDDGRLNQLRLVELAAIESFAKGNATPADWRSLVDMLNVAETMASKGLGVEVTAACHAAQAALEEAHRRHHDPAIKKMGVTGPELQALRDLHAYHDLQRTSITRSEYERCIRDTGNRIKSAHPSHKRYCA